jgi:Lon protease-like protein
MPMFPLGSVLFPAMPLALRVFEERYLKMMGAILDDEVPQFGVVLIERGHEVGGGEKPFEIGTLAEVLEIAAPDGPLAVVARGTTRFQITDWVSDDPYPMAEVTLMDTLHTTGGDEKRVAEAESVVRGAVDYLESAVGGVAWSADIELSDDVEERVWQLAGMSPLGPLDHYDFLHHTSVESLSTHLQTTVSEALDVFKLTQRSVEDGDDSEDLT